MAHADRNTLHRSKIELDRQQREEEPQVPGATGGPDDVSPESAEVMARKRRGKTGKHTNDDTPAG
jgi:hypothetical protein